MQPIQTQQVFSKDYGGPAYSVKYLGIVDGTMGILSRKMALQNETKQSSLNGIQQVKVNNRLSKMDLSFRKANTIKTYQGIKPLLSGKYDQYYENRGITHPQ